ncbi:ABC transporter ATP-binding protein [Parabacteroides sp. OttesenSCG-928-J18]|jgi:fluoroquinolone transport system ATP-binding protein|nr:ABC transporter ATP-binding protein [Parabacteroides sp. OttesenSCG-928-J18]
MIQVKNVYFSYTDSPFIENINFNVGKGEILGFLGPSGAGKSTLQKILTGLLSNYQGEVIVNGTDLTKKDSSFYEDIGIDFEFPSLYEKFTAVENLKFFGSLYSKELVPIDELLEMIGLSNDGNKKVSEYSKGMKSRLNFIKALIHRPDVIFLDEPTSGLDPANSRIMKGIIRRLKEQGKTIIVTTHNMHDAAELCDRVAFIIDGKIKALDTPRNLMKSKDGAKIVYTYYYNGKECSNEVQTSATSSNEQLAQLLAENRILSIHSMEPTLEDIFVELTGRRLQ